MTPAHTASMVGKRLLSMQRKGKQFFLSFNGEVYVLFHCRLTGKFFFRNAGAWLPSPANKLIITFVDGSSMAFRDDGNTAVTSLMLGKSNLLSFLSEIAPDPIVEGINPVAFKVGVARSCLSIVDLLKEQKTTYGGVVSGLGSIYASEVKICHFCRFWLPHAFTSSSPRRTGRLPGGDRPHDPQQPAERGASRQADRADPGHPQDCDQVSGRPRAGRLARVDVPEGLAVQVQRGHVAQVRGWRCGLCACFMTTASRRKIVTTSK
jgi:hypothetical protein